MENHIGRRIERARKRLGLSTRALGEKIGKSHTAIRKYEGGEITPDSSILSNLADALELPVEYFLRPLRVEVRAEAFRTHFDLPPTEKKRVLAEIEEKAERFLELLYIYPHAPVEEFAIPDEIPQQISDIGAIEIVAESVRDAWDLGRNAIPNLLDELEKNGILVFLLDYDGPSEVDGLCARVDERPVIGLGPGWPGDRQRFTAAHELGHFILDDRLSSAVDTEDACNRFAGALLVPRSEVIEHLGKARKELEPRELYRLKHKYGLSMAGWLHRAQELDVISDSTYEDLRRQFDRRGWHENEPGDDYPSQEPSLFEELVYRAYSQDIIGESKAAELLGTSSGEFYRRRTMTEE